MGLHIVLDLLLLIRQRLYERLFIASLHNQPVYPKMCWIDISTASNWLAEILKGDFLTPVPLVWGFGWTWGGGTPVAPGYDDKYRSLEATASSKGKNYIVSHIL